MREMVTDPTCDHQDYICIFIKKHQPVFLVIEKKASPSLAIWVERSKTSWSSPPSWIGAWTPVLESMRAGELEIAEMSGADVAEVVDGVAGSEQRLLPGVSPFLSSERDFLSPWPKYIFESARVRSDENINTRKILSRDYQACTAGGSSAIFCRRCLFVSQEFVSSFLTLEVVYCKEFGRLPVAHMF